MVAVFLALATPILIGASGSAAPIPGYGDLIDNYCISRGRLRVPTHQPHCAMCHQPGTFDNSLGNRVQPNWSEFERGRATGDFNYFCPGGAAQNTAPATGDAQAATSSTPAADTAAMQAPTPGLAAAQLEAPGMVDRVMRGHEMGTGGMIARMTGLDPAPMLPTKSTPHTAPSTIADSPPRGAQPSSPAGQQAGQSATAPLLEQPPPAQVALEQRLTQLRDELAIRDPQRAAWESFAEGIRSAAERRRALAAFPRDTDGSLALLQMEQRRTSARLAALRSVSTDFSRLLAVLDEAQRKTAAQRFRAVLEVL